MKHLIRQALLASPILFAICAWSTAEAQQLAFPGAEGFGRYATGGRQGTVYHVTNLNDAGSRLDIEVNRQAKTADRLTVQDRLTAGGTLHVSLVDGSYAVGDVLAILSAKTYASAFDAILPEVPAEGLAWDTSTLLSDGKLRVVSAATVGITTVSHGDSRPDAPAFDLQGRRVNAHSKGLIVKDGRLIFLGR